MRSYAPVLAVLFAAPLFAGEGALIYLDRDTITGIAFAAVYRGYPDTPPGDLALRRHGITLFCPSTRYVEEIYASQTEIPRFIDLSSASAGAIQPCVADVAVEFISTVTEVRYRDDFGKCRLARTRQDVSVYVYQDGSTAVGRLGMGVGDGGTECTEAFRGAPVCSGNPLMNAESCRAETGDFTDHAELSATRPRAHPDPAVDAQSASADKSGKARPFHVDVDSVLEIASQAVHEQYPQLPPAQLQMDQGMFVHCAASSPLEPAAEGGTPSCHAQFDAFFAASELEGTNSGREANCETGTRVERIGVMVTESGRTHVSRGYGVECAEISAH